MSEPRFAAWRARVEATLDRVLPDPAASPARLHAAMRHGVLNGGKRMRPLLAYATGTAFGVDEDALDAAAAAVELVHCYSLVHDDLPAMDNDLERRGRPTVHVAFGHPQAILIGDALLTHAFEVLGRGVSGVSGDRIAAAMTRLAHHAGIHGMVGGQALDIAHGQDIHAIELLERVHALKTGALYAAGGAIGALCGGASGPQVHALESWGLKFGIAFQHADDILDDDQKALRSLALARVDQLVAECQALAEPFGPLGEPLHALAVWVRDRAHAAAAGVKAE